MRATRLAVAVILSLLAIPVSTISAAIPSIPDFGLHEEDFRRISTGGFVDSANSYSWGMAVFEGNLYVGTNRHHLWSIGEGFKAGGIEIPIDIVEDPESTTIGSVDWARDMRGEIWRYRNGIWEIVHQSPIMYWKPPPGVPFPPEGHYPESYGYRMMGTFNGKLYVCGIGTWWPPMPFSRIIRSETGNWGSWEDVTRNLAGTTNVRGLIEYNGKLHVSASKPGASPTGAGLGAVFCTTDPTLGWTQVSPDGFGNMNNAEVPYLTIFNGYLYASTVNYEEGFEVWKTDGTLGPDGFYVWTQVVSNGFGDTWNQWGMTMEVFNDHLYVGSAVGAGLVMKDSEIVGTRAFDVIRIDKDDNVELVVGAYIPSDPPAGWPTSRTPLSGWPAGFGNPLNVYVWHMKVHDGVLYLGTLDVSVFLQYLPDLIESLMSEGELASLKEELGSALSDPGFQELLEQNPELAQYLDELLAALTQAQETGDVSQLIALLVQYFGGADLWKTEDGIFWMPVTLNGFDNPCNYGIRRLLSSGNRLFVGTANPFTGNPRGGCEVLEGALRIESCDSTGAKKDTFDLEENVYVRGIGYRHCTTYDIYVVNDVVFWCDGMTIPERVPGTLTTVSPDSSGDIPPTVVWHLPLTPGKYDIVLDVNGNGQYDAYVDALDNCDVRLTAGFFVIPEYPLGTILGLFMCLAALGVFKSKRMHI